jgi:acetate kinase
VFDTAFHHTIPPKAYIYGLPYALYEKLGIRRYGFHGTSHRFVAKKASELLGKPLNRVNLITCHLGNGASLAAIRKGKSVDTTMGFTPLEGLVMGTRCGDIDPALVPYIMDREKLTANEIDSIMNKNSGMLGLTETSNDMREIEAEAMRGSQQHILALDIYCYRLTKYIGSYLAVLGQVDALVFTGGIGEKSFYVREHTLEGLASLGLKIDLEKNNNNAQEIGTGKIKVLVIPTNEELAIAHDTLGMLQDVSTPVSPVKEEKADKKTTRLSKNDKAALILLWAESPDDSIQSLTRKLNLKQGKKLTKASVEQELRILGLRTSSGENVEKVG